MSNAKMLSQVRCNGKAIYVMAKGLRLTTRGKIQGARDVAVRMAKGDRRKMRKELVAIGRSDLMFQTLHS